MFIDNNNTSCSSILISTVGVKVPKKDDPSQPYGHPSQAAFTYVLLGVAGKQVSCGRYT